MGVIAAILGAIAAIPVLKTMWPGSGPLPAGTLDELADKLASAVKKQWTDAAMDRQLIQADALRVRWQRSTRPLVGPVSAATRSRRFTPLPGLAAIGEEQLRYGELCDLHAIYGGLGSGRLVIAGGQGSGKSGSAARDWRFSTRRRRRRCHDQARPGSRVHPGGSGQHRPRVPQRSSCSRRTCRWTRRS